MTDERHEKDRNKRHRLEHLGAALRMMFQPIVGPFRDTHRKEGEAMQSIGKMKAAAEQMKLAAAAITPPKDAPAPLIAAINEATDDAVRFPHG